MRQAQELFTQSLLTGLRVLGCASLPACYGHPGVALVLMGSGRLSVQVRRRLKEMILFLTKVMEPGSLNEGAAPGSVWIRKVRFMHALMRWLTCAPGAGYEGLTDDKPSNVLLKLDWQRDATPINQVELAYVLLTFSWLLVRGFKLLGVRMNAAQRDAHIYTWAVIGHGLGIEAALRPREAGDAQKLFERIRDEFERGTEEGRLLTAALIVYVVIRQREAISEFLPSLRRPGLRWLVRLVKPFAEACLESLARTLVRDLAGPRRRTGFGRARPVCPLGGRKTHADVHDRDRAALQAARNRSAPRSREQARAGMKCLRCQQANPPQARFCFECAAPFELRGAAPEAYTPPYLAEKIRAGRGALRGERKRVTVMFADLEGSMALLAGRDPEDARLLLDGVLERMPRSNGSCLRAPRATRSSSRKACAR